MKSFFKAAVAVAASAVMVISMSSCGRSASSADSDPDAVKAIDSSKATGSLTIWAMGNEGDLLGDFVKGFEKENPDVKVKVTFRRYWHKEGTELYHQSLQGRCGGC